MTRGAYRPFTEEERRGIGRLWVSVSAPWRRLVRPILFGHERVPSSSPAIWAGNHSLYAFADASLMVSGPISTA